MTLIEKMYDLSVDLISVSVTLFIGIVAVSIALFLSPIWTPVIVVLWVYSREQKRKQAKKYKATLNDFRQKDN